MALSESQQFILFFLPKFGFLSVLSSSLIAYTILRDPKKMSKSYHRLLLTMSCVDACVSSFHAVGTWPMPEDSGGIYAIGNRTTCTIQGFMTHNSVVPSFFSVSLAIYYTLVIRYDWSEVQVRKVEPFMTSIPIMWGLGTGMVAIPLKLFNPAGLWW
jgi:hypothetical protein